MGMKSLLQQKQKTSVLYSVYVVCYVIHWWGEEKEESKLMVPRCNKYQCLNTRGRVSKSPKRAIPDAIAGGQALIESVQHRSGGGGGGGGDGDGGKSVCRDKECLLYGCVDLWPLTRLGSDKSSATSTTTEP